MTAKEEGAGTPACFAHELASGADGAFHTVDPRQAADVARWRKAERERLIAARLASPVAEREDAAARIAAALDTLAAPAAGRTIGVYWPFRGEPDLRAWMARAHEAGARIALPVVERKAAPLVFRHWYPGVAMERGVWNILQPAGDERLVPDIVIAPLVGHDGEGYRLGYGGGFYDRTLAAITPRPRAIGIGQALTRIPTIYPQIHDVPMDAIVTETGTVTFER